MRLVALGVLAAPYCVAQAPEGPIHVDPSRTAQLAADSIKLRTILVNTPVTVLNEKGAMLHNLEESDFTITDNGVPQKITHFNLGGDPISLVVVVERSARIASALPKIRRAGILISQTVIGPTGEGAVIAYDDRVTTLLDFNDSADAMEKTFSTMEEGSAGTRLFDAMSRGVEMLSRRPEVSDNDLGHRRVMLVIGE